MVVINIIIGVTLSNIDNSAHIGGIIFGLAFLYFYTKRKKMNLLLLLDIIVVGLILAQAIGRWGNFFNGEAHGNVAVP